MKSSGGDNNVRFINVARLVADDIAGIFPYLFVSYLVCLALARWQPAWRDMLYWPAFHVSVLALGLISVLSDRARKQGVGKFLSGSFIAFFSSVLTAGRRLPAAARIKAVIIIFCAALSLLCGAAPLDFLVIMYALAAVMFRYFDGGMAIIIALVALAICALLDIFGPAGISQWALTYAFYLLTVALIVNIVYLIRGDKAEISTPDRVKLF